MNKENKEQLKKILENEYFQPTLIKYEEKHKELMDSGFTDKQATVKILDYLTDILTSSTEGVEEVINERFNDGLIKDKAQTRKSVAGNNFQKLVTYSLLKNVKIGNLSNNIIVTLTASNNKIIKEYAVIHANEEEQKPDVDVLVYNANIEKNTLPIVIFSCKTSMRERAGQTYKWKLLLDIATSECEHISDTPECPHNLYKIKYDKTRDVYMVFTTSDLYNEVSQPQIAGMFSFFDKTYVTKPAAPSVSNLETFSNVIDFLNNIYTE